MVGQLTNVIFQNLFNHIFRTDFNYYTINSGCVLNGLQVVIPTIMRDAVDHGRVTQYSCRNSKGKVSCKYAHLVAWEFK